MRRYLSCAIAVAMLVTAAKSAVAQGIDTVLVNGKIVTVDPQSSVRSAVAIRDGRIAAVGTDAEIRQLAVELRPVADPELVLFAEMNGEPVGCAVSIPDVNQVLKRMNGRLFPFGIFHFLRRRQIISRTRMLMLGVLPSVRRLGLYPLLIAEAAERTARRGYRHAEVGWTLEDNTLINAGIAAAGGAHYKTYRLYEKPVG